MKLEDVEVLIEMLKAGMKYYKPLPYKDVDGGTTIIWDDERSVFVEYYLNHSLLEYINEHIITERSETELIDMFVTQKYTDRHYPLYTASEEFRLFLPGEEVQFEYESSIKLSDLHPSDMDMAVCEHCRSTDVYILWYGYDINPVTGDRYVSLGVYCKLCRKTSSYAWDT